MVQRIVAFPAAGEQGKPRGKRQDYGDTQWPLEQRQLRAPRLHLQRRGRELVDSSVNLLKLSAIFGAEELTAGRARHRLQHGKIDAIVADCVRIADAD